MARSEDLWAIRQAINAATDPQERAYLVKHYDNVLINGELRGDLSGGAWYSSIYNAVKPLADKASAFYDKHKGKLEAVRHAVHNYQQARKKAPGSQEHSHEASHAAAQGAYAKDGANIEGYETIHSSPTIKAYKKAGTNNIIIGVRGTDVKDMNDIKADISTLSGSLKDTQRYKQDVEEVKRILANNPSSNFHVASHSLGAAIADRLMDEFPEIKTGRAYNGAFEPYAFVRDSRQERVYNNNDFLGQLGRYLPGAEHRSDEPQGDSPVPEHKIPTIMQALQDHSLSVTGAGGKWIIE